MKALVVILLLLCSSTIVTSLRGPPSPAPSTLDPKQVIALESLDIPTARDPCGQPSFHNATLCDNAKPFRHLISLRLANCSTYLSLSFTALKALSTLRSLTLLNCPAAPTRLPPQLATSLTSFTCVNSLRKLSGVWLSQLQNLTHLTVSDVQVKASGPFVILAHMSKLTSLTISNANLTGSLPGHLHSNLTHIDFSLNHLKGSIPPSITMLQNLQTLNLSSNALSGQIPPSIGDLISLLNLSLASNSFSGSIPDSLSALPDLLHMDLSSNQLNGSIPKFISQIKSLRYLNLANNNLRGVVPFNLSFINRLEVFKVAGNSNLCYNRSVLSSKLKLGISPCDKFGMPVSPPAKDSSADDTSDDDYDETDDEGSRHKKDHHHGPNKFVLGVAIALSSIVFLIVFLILCSKCCR